MARRKTHEEFVEEIRNKNPNIKILSKYINSRNKILCECKICDKRWNTLPTSLSRGNGCPSCGFEKTRLSVLSNTQEFIQKLHLINSNITITSEYISAKTKIGCKCNICGKEFQMKPNNLLNGSGCPECAKVKRRNSQLLSDENFYKRLSICNPEIELLEKYNGMSKKILCRCKTHNCEWNARPSELLKGHGCPKCYSERIGKALRLSQEDFEKQLQEKNPNIILIGKYINASTHTECKCKKCGHIWKPNLNNLIYGKITGCPKCQSYSKGEDKIQDYLELNQIQYIIHKQYDELIGVGGKNLSYDFYIPSLNLLIEYQGQQHEKAITFGSMSVKEANIQFEVQQEHDRRKREYAKEHNISLLEIWYWDFDNVEQILSEKLNINSNKKSA